MKKIDSLKNYYKRITKKNNSGKKGDTIKNIKTTIKKNTKSITQKLKKTKIGKTVKKYGNKIKNQMKKTGAKVSKTFKSALKKSKKLGKSLKEKYKKTKAKITKKAKSAIARLGKTSAWKTIKKYKNKFKGELKKTKAAITRKYKSAVKKIKSSKVANVVTKSKKTGGVLAKLKNTFIPTCYAGEIKGSGTGATKLNDTSSKPVNYTTIESSVKKLMVDNATREEKNSFLFPNGIPDNEKDMKQYLTTVKVPLTKKDGTRFYGNVVVHKALAKDVKEAFQIAADSGYKIYDIGPVNEKTNLMTGGYSWRPNGNNSMHSLGIAIDINPYENPMYNKNGIMKKQFKGQKGYDPNNEYAITKDSPLVKAFEERGWVWGGNWSESGKKDYMHFSYNGE